MKKVRSSIVFKPDNVQITVNNEAAEAREIILLLSKHTDEALLAQVDPNAESDDLQVLQDELGISFYAIEDQLDLENNPTVFNVIERIQHASSGIYSSIDPMGNVVYNNILTLELSSLMRRFV